MKVFVVLLISAFGQDLGDFDFDSIVSIGKGRKVFLLLNTLENVSFYLKIKLMSVQRKPLNFAKNSSKIMIPLEVCYERKYKILIPTGGKNIGDFGHFRRYLGRLKVFR